MATYSWPCVKPLWCKSISRAPLNDWPCTLFFLIPKQTRTANWVFIHPVVGNALSPGSQGTCGRMNFVPLLLPVAVRGKSTLFVVESMKYRVQSTCPVFGWRLPSNITTLSLSVLAGCLEAMMFWVNYSTVERHSEVRWFLLLKHSLRLRSLRIL